MREVSNLLYANINGIDGKIKIVPVDLLSHVKKEWLQCLEQLDMTDMYNKMLKDYFDFSLTEDIKSLIMIALPSPPCYVEIEWKSVNV